MKQFIYSIVFFLISFSAFGQSIMLLNPTEKYHYYTEINRLDSNYFPSMYSLQNRELIALKKDSIQDKKNIHFCTKPLFELGAAYDLSDKQFHYRSALGLSSIISWNKIKAGIDYSYHLSTLPNFLDSFVQNNRLIPSQSIPKAIGNKAYAFHQLRFFVHYQATDYFSVESGYGKHFIGDGYRSLLLSDNAANYPYLKLETQIFKKLRYTNLYAKLSDVTNPLEDSWYSQGNKYFASHYLSWNATKRLRFSFFETVVWNSHDSTGGRNFEWYYLNPVVFYRPVEFALGSPDNMLMGLNLSYHCGNKSLFYAQYLIDEFYLNEIRADISHLLHPNDSTINHGAWVNKQAFQLGFKSYQFLGIENSFFRSEFNLIRPYTYSHRRTEINYTHHHQSLAHPWNSNIYEFIMEFAYYKERWSIENRFIYALIGTDKDSTTHVGQNILLPSWESSINNTAAVNYYGNTIGQGSQQYLLYNKICFNYLLFPKYSLNLSAGYIYRKQSSRESSMKTNYFFLRLSTGISDWFTDR